MQPVQCGGRITQITPTYLLGTHYILQSRSNLSTDMPTKIAITASKNNTEIVVKLFPTKDNSTDISYDNISYNGGDTLRRELDSFQTMLFSWNRSISRIDINSSAPVAVFYAEADGVTSQPLPVTRWGNHFITFPISQRSDIVQITGQYQQSICCHKYRNVIPHSSDSKLVL